MHEQASIVGSWNLVLRAAVLLAVVAAIAALGWQLGGEAYVQNQYLWQNQLPIKTRVQLVRGIALAAILGGGAIGLVAAALKQQISSVAFLLWRVARVASPLAPLAFLPVMLNWQLWKDHELIYLTLVVVLSFGLKAAISAAIDAKPLDLLVGCRPSESRWGTRLRQVWSKLPTGSWFAFVILAAIVYAVWFSYYTIVWHRSARSGWDLSIEDNILWNIVHGGPFFKAAPALGPTGAHFARHSTIIAYVLAPFYALYQSAEMVLIMQTVLMGAAAIPLFLFGRGRVGAPLAALFSILYLMHPGVQESNLFEMHYVKLGTLPFWTTLWLLDTRRYRGALVAAAITLCVREDVATWIVLLGAFAFIAGVRWRVSLSMFIGGLLYVAIVKFMIMPALVGGHDELLFMYQELLPAGKNSFAWAMIVAVTNPAYVLRTLLTEEKLIYFLHILTPLAFVPLRRPIGWFALVPGMVFCFLSTKYSPLVDIHFQYSPHLLAMLYPATILILGAELKRTPADESSCERSTVTPSHSGVIATVSAITFATLLCSSQFGAVIQQNTSRGGPIPYRFGWDDEGRTRYQALQEVLAMLPKDASVAASAFTITQVSARANAYSLSIDTYDAEYIVATTNRGELVPSEATRLAQIFENGSFGVVAMKKPFFLMRRGHSTELNARVRREIR